MTDPITSFRGTFLSNFWPAWIKREAGFYPSVENAYVAEKIAGGIFRNTNAERDLLRTIASLRVCSASEAKRIGRRFPMRPRWEEMRIDIMRALIAEKFGPANSHLATLLVNTGDAELIEGNTWGDEFWGVCRGRGENNLGKLLMRRRTYLLESCRY